MLDKTHPSGTLDALAHSAPEGLEARLLVLLRKNRGDGPFPLDASLGEDLGMDGDDAVEFFEAVGREFHVDFATIRWDRHFGPEGFDPFGLFSRACGRLLPITVQQVLDAAKSAHWRYQYPDDEP